jgi:hypothetical protein
MAPGCIARSAWLAETPPPPGFAAPLFRGARPFPTSTSIQPGNWRWSAAALRLVHLQAPHSQYGRSARRRQFQLSSSQARKANALVADLAG